MSAIIFHLLKAHWRVAAVIALLAAIAVQHLEIARLDGEMAREKALNAMLMDSNKRLAASLRFQNDAVMALKAESDAKAAAAAHALAKAHRQANVYAARAKTIMVRKESGDACADMKALLKEVGR